MRTTLTCSCLLAASALAQPTFITLDGSSVGLPVDSVSVVHVRDDGTVFFTLGGSSSLYHAFRWHESTGYVELPLPSGATESIVRSISRNGEFVLGAIRRPFTWHSIMWDDAYTPNLVPLIVPHPFTSGGAQLVSNDGRIIVGWLGGSTVVSDAIAYIRDDNQIVLASPPEFLYATAMSADGSQLFGYELDPAIYAFSPWKWTPTTGFTYLAPAPSSSPTEVFRIYDASEDGTVVVGLATYKNTNSTAIVRLDPSYHQWINITPPGVTAGYPSTKHLALDGEGWRLVGEAGIPVFNGSCFLWEPVLGMRPISHVAADLGLNLSKYALLSATDISTDGRHIVGTALTNVGGQIKPVIYRLTIPPFCYADCNRATGQRTLDLFDFLCFQQHFLQQSPYANCNRDDAIDLHDYLCFVNHFTDGCP